MLWLSSSKAARRVETLGESFDIASRRGRKRRLLKTKAPAIQTRLLTSLFWSDGIHVERPSGSKKDSLGISPDARPKPKTLEIKTAGAYSDTCMLAYPIADCAPLACCLTYDTKPKHTKSSGSPAAPPPPPSSRASREPATSPAQTIERTFENVCLSCRIPANAVPGETSSPQRRQCVRLL
jgi:hypothetical protein